MYNTLACWQLNDVGNGGRTVFPKLKVSIKPQKGSAVLWFNIDSQSKRVDAMLHGACPVLRGTKWGQFTTHLFQVLSTFFFNKLILLHFWLQYRLKEWATTLPQRLWKGPQHWKIKLKFNSNKFLQNLNCFKIDKILNTNRFSLFN